MTQPATADKMTPAAGLDTEFRRGLGLFDATMVVIGSMIGSGIFIVSADMSRLIGSPGWMLMAWVLAGVLTVCAALHAKLRMPRQTSVERAIVNPHSLPPGGSMGDTVIFSTGSQRHFEIVGQA